MNCKVLALVILMLPACTIVSTSDAEWRWPQEELVQVITVRYNYV